MKNYDEVEEKLKREELKKRKKKMKVSGKSIFVVKKVIDKKNKKKS